jgi:chromatin modification-related protein VID21
MKIKDILSEAVIQKSAQVPQPGSPELNAFQAAKTPQQQAQQPQAQQPSAGNSAFGQMAQQLGNNSSTGGKVQQTATGQVHTANPANPNQPQAQQQEPVQQTQPQQQAQQAQPAAQKVTVGQINKTIPTLRTRDVQSVKKTADATLAQKTPAQAQQQQQQAEPAQQPTAQAQGGQFTDEYGNLDPTKLSPEQIRGYEFVNGKLVKKNPGFFKQAGQVAKSLAQKALGTNRNINAPVNQDMRNPIPDYEHDTFKKANAMKQQGQQPQAQTAPAATTPKSSSGIAKGMRQATAKPAAPQAPQAQQQQAPAQQQQAPQAQAQQPSPQLAPGVKVMSQEPIRLRVKNREFNLDDNGQWVNSATGKTTDQATTAFLNQQHDVSLGLK